MGDLFGEELEEAVELVRVATERGGEVGRIGVVHRLDGPDLHLQSPTESLDASQDAHRVTLAESLVEQLDVAPDPRLDATARVRELEGEIRRARLGAPPLLLGDREHPLHGPVLGELGDRGHGPESRAGGPLVRSPRWATCSRFAPSVTPARPARSSISSHLPTTQSAPRSATSSSPGARSTSST